MFRTCDEVAQNELKAVQTDLPEGPIPNTTNLIEGAINAPMQEKLRSHRGLNPT